jgi:hypothetical protein
MELKSTIEMMNSPDYKERFKAEYYQLEIRIGKLINLLSAWDCGELGFTPKCSYDLLEAQLNAMKAYSYMLKRRAEIEEICLKEIACKNCVHAHKIDDIEWECDAEEYDTVGLSCFTLKE